MEYSKNNTENKGKDHADSNSLWNCTISPGWKQYETKILLNALQYYGIGRWKKILDSQCLPDKSIGQIYMRTQRLLGQQSLGDFMGLKVDINAIFRDNMKKTNATRKSNCIINTGDNPTKEERKRRIQEHQIKYGLSKEQLAKLEKPEGLKQGVSHFFTLEDIETKAKKLTTIEILERIDELKNEIERRISLCDQGNTQVYIQQKSVDEDVLEQSTDNSKKRKRKVSQKTDKRKKNQKKMKKNESSYSESSTLEEQEEDIPLESDKEEEIEQIEMDSEEENEMKKNEKDDELYDYDEEENKKPLENEQIFMEDDYKNEKIQDDLSEKEAIF